MARSRKKSSSSYVVTSRVREHLQSLGMRMGSDLVPALDEAVALVIEEAASRAEWNGRKTVGAGDL